MKSIFISFLFLFSLVSLTMAQLISLKIESIDVTEVEIGDKISIPIYCEGLDGEIGSFQMYIEYDHDVLAYQSVSNINSEVKKNLKYNNTENFWAAVWISLSRETLNISPGTKLFELEFIYNGGETLLEFGKESILQDKRIVKGKTMFVTLDSTHFSLDPENGCVCKKGN